MFLIYGRKKMRIKHYADHQHRCNDCSSLDLTVLVFKEYFHVFWIPFFPAGIKSSSVYCSSCGNPTRFDSLQRQYEEKTRSPFYLYTGLILIGLLISLAVVANLNTQKEKRTFVQNPMPGDVYTMRQESGDSTGYYFLRISRLNGDTVFAWHNSLIYYGYVSQFEPHDFFTKEEELFYTKSELLQMLDKGEINAVNRAYGTREGFDRLR